MHAGRTSAPSPTPFSSGRGAPGARCRRSQPRREMCSRDVRGPGTSPSWNCSSERTRGATTSGRIFTGTVQSGSERLSRFCAKRAGRIMTLPSMCMGVGASNLRSRLFGHWNLTGSFSTKRLFHQKTWRPWRRFNVRSIRLWRQESESSEDTASVKFWRSRPSGLSNPTLLEPAESPNSRRFARWPDLFAGRRFSSVRLFRNRIKKPAV